MSEITPTRTAVLELQEERRGMEEGYRFLDEKRLVLAAEILRVLGDYQQAWGALSQDYVKAADALLAAVTRHGLEGMQIYPPASYATAALEIGERSILGVIVQDVALTLEPAEMPPPANQSPEAEQCKQRYVEIMRAGIALAALRGNLLRLFEEYQRTSRRARALEDVLLPEMDRTLGELAVSLEELDREESIRVRFGRYR
jgi:V/A-type H+-transporting ATPase subunit D